MNKKVYYNVWMEIEKVTISPDDTKYEDITSTGEAEPMKLMTTPDLNEAIAIMRRLEFFGGLNDGE